MVIKFDSDVFKQEVIELFGFLEKHYAFYDFYDLTDECEQEDEEEKIIDKDFELPVQLPHAYDEKIHTIGEWLNIVKEVNQVIEFDENKFVSNKLALFSIDDQMYELVHSYDFCVPEIKESMGGQEYTINIVNGLTAYGVKLVTENLFDKYNPPVHDADFFIEISTEGTIDINIVDSIVDAYLFEIKSTLDISIQLSSRFSLLIEDEPDFNSEMTRLRPLLQGKGIHELLKLYNSSLASVSDDILVLTYTKVIEYVSQTVIQQDLINSATKKLFSSRALNPDANYILELGEIFDKNRNNQKDYLAIRLTIETCCDLNEIVAIAPQFLKSTRKLKSDSKNEDKIKAAIEIADAISNTRNMFAHAKTNYEKKGMECPAEQLEEFAKCLDILAQQVIRWFAKEHEDIRVI